MLLLLKNLLFTILVPGTIAVYVPVFVIPHARAVISPIAIGAGFLLLAGISIYLWSVWEFAVFGRGTPAPVDSPRYLVVRGLYRYSRNPMYVGVLSIVFGWSLWFRSPSLAIYGCAVAACFHLFVVLYEEPRLSRVFGESYDQYRARVPRWVWFRRAP